MSIDRTKQTTRGQSRGVDSPYNMQQVSYRNIDRFILGMTTIFVDSIRQTQLPMTTSVPGRMDIVATESSAYNIINWFRKAFNYRMLN